MRIGRTFASGAPTRVIDRMSSDSWMAGANGLVDESAQIKGRGEGRASVTTATVELRIGGYRRAHRGRREDLRERSDTGEGLG
jgi:hypothetical protein